MKNCKVGKIDYTKEFTLNEKVVLNILSKLEEFSKRNSDEILPDEGLDFVIKYGIKASGNNFRKAKLDIMKCRSSEPCEVLGSTLNIEQMCRCALITKVLIHMNIPTKDGKSLYIVFCRDRYFAKFLLPYIQTLRGTDMDFETATGFKFLKTIEHILRDETYSVAAVLAVYKKLQNKEKLIFNHEKFIAKLLSESLDIEICEEERDAYSKYFDIDYKLENDLLTFLMYDVGISFRHSVIRSVKEALLIIKKGLV